MLRDFRLHFCQAIYLAMRKRKQRCGIKKNHRNAGLLRHPPADLGHLRPFERERSLRRVEFPVTLKMKGFFIGSEINANRSANSTSSICPEKKLGQRRRVRAVFFMRNGLHKSHRTLKFALLTEQTHN